MRNRYFVGKVAYFVLKPLLLLKYKFYCAISILLAKWHISSISLNAHMTLTFGLKSYWLQANNNKKHYLIHRIVEQCMQCFTHIITPVLL